MTRPKLLTIEQVAELYPAIKLRTLRYWIQNAQTRKVSKAGQRYELPGNGLGKAIIRVDRIILVDEERFLEWLNSRRVEAA